MKTWQKWALISLPILVGGFIVYKQLNKGKEKPKEEETPEPTPTPKETTPTTTSGNDSFPLQKGSQGAKVKELQKYILAKDSKALPKYKADGKWGKETEDAMYKYFFSLITIKDGKISVDSQEQMDKIKAASKPTYKAGSPLVFQYQSPMGQVSPLLTIK